MYEVVDNIVITLSKSKHIAMEFNKIIIETRGTIYGVIILCDIRDFSVIEC